MEQKNSSKVSESPGEASAKAILPGKNNKETEIPAEASAKSPLTAVDNGEPQNPVETPVEPESSRKRTPKSLRANPVVKKGKDAQGIPRNQKRVRRRKNKSVAQENKLGNGHEHKNDQNLTSREEKTQKKGPQDERYSHQDTRKSQEKVAGSSRSGSNLKTEGKPGSKAKSSGTGKNKGKLDMKENSQGNERKKEKLGGLIFMCSSKTKPDCFRYRVMGVSTGKKDLVMGVKPGLKLFLYDFDLRLMYGIYKASSSGGMKLEPKAFGGAFPVQVRFSIHKDCVPVPESIFKRAIKENYDEKNKFKIELTNRQVRKLSELFRPVMYESVQSTPVPIHFPSKETVRDGEFYEGYRDLRPPSHREKFPRVIGDGKSYPVPDRDQGILHQDVVPMQREEAPRDLFMTEKEYRIYGLQRERRNLTPLRGPTSALDPYQNLEREHLRADPPYLAQREIQNFNLGGRTEFPPAAAAAPVSAALSSSAGVALGFYTRDPYYSHPYRGASSANAYMLHPRREEVSSGSYYYDNLKASHLIDAHPLHRIETDQVDKLCLKYAINPLPDYNRAYRGAKPEIAQPPVSARYSFAGPAMSHR